MGIKGSDLAPIQVTPYTPPGKEVKTKIFQVARTDTVTAVKAQLPANVSIIDIRFFTNTASDATTSASISLGNGTTTTAFVNAQDVKTAAGIVRPTSTVGNIAVTETVPLGGNIQITATYLSSGAQTVGGPWVVFVDYVE